ncbi:hypothetical protein, partial [Microbacterium aurantiacum]|uniref:hypothetical protein n=1 Tax=Microbacterium aurantiacum TaxID=162393 RepID=UPI003D72CAFC
PESGAMNENSSGLVLRYQGRLRFPASVGPLRECAVIDRHAVEREAGSGPATQVSPSTRSNTPFRLYESSG